MTNTLKKNVTVTVASGTPGTPGSPGTAPTPARCVTTTTTAPTMTTVLVPLPLEFGQTEAQRQYQAMSYSGAPVTTSTTVCTPASAGIPAVAPTPGTPNTTTKFLNLGWNSGGRSLSELTGSGAVAFSAAAGNLGTIAGLHAGALTFSFAEVEHGFYIRKNYFTIIESGVEKTGALAYVAADVFRIERSDYTVRYYKGTTLVYTSATLSFGSRYLEAAIYGGGDTILDASITNSISAVVGATGSGTATLQPLVGAASEGNKSTGIGTFAAMTGTATGYVQQGGSATMLPLEVKASNYVYADGRGSMSALTGTANSEVVPSLNLAVGELLPLLGSAVGTVAGTSLAPRTSVSDATAAWTDGSLVGATITFTGGAGAGQSATIGANTGQNLFLTAPLATAPDATTTYEIRNAAGVLLYSGTVTPGGGGATLLPLVGKASNYAYSEGRGSMLAMTGFATYLTPLSGWGWTTAGAATLLASGHDSTGELSADDLTMPAATLAGFGGANFTLNVPVPTLAVTATSTILGVLDATAPAATLDATGVVVGGGTAALELRYKYEDAFTLTARGGASAQLTGPGAGLTASALTGGVGTAALKGVGAQLAGYGGALCSVTVEGITLASTATVGASGRVRAQLKLFELVAEGTAQNYGSAELIAPDARMGGTAVVWALAPAARMVSVGTAVVAVSYEAYAVNLNHPPEVKHPSDEVTHYTNYPFTHVVRHQGSYFGVAADGLYLLEGTTDHGAVPIPWALKTSVTDFGQVAQKTVGAAYFGGRMGDATATLYAGESSGVAYPYSTPRGELAQNYRQKFGKGIKARYYALGVTGTGTLELDGIEFDIHALTRRI